MHTSSPVDGRGDAPPPARDLLSAPVAGAAARAAARIEIVGCDASDDRVAVSGLILAAVAALSGTVVWVGVSLFLGREITLLAWPIGLVIGVGAARGGGRGLRAGALCAALALVSILGGHVVSSALAAERTAVEVAAERQSLLAYYRERYDEDMSDAAAFAGLPHADATVRRFMVERGFTDADRSDRIGDEELAGFLDHEGPWLLALAERRPSFEAWMRSDGDPWLVDGPAVDDVAVDGGRGIAGSLVGGLGPVDLLFVLLGVGSAFARGRALGAGDD